MDEQDDDARVDSCRLRKGPPPRPLGRVCRRVRQSPTYPLPRVSYLPPLVTEHRMASERADGGLCAVPVETDIIFKKQNRISQMAVFFGKHGA